MKVTSLSTLFIYKTHRYTLLSFLRLLATFESRHSKVRLFNSTTIVPNNHFAIYRPIHNKKRWASIRRNTSMSAIVPPASTLNITATDSMMETIEDTAVSNTPPTRPSESSTRYKNEADSRSFTFRGRSPHPRPHFFLASTIICG